MDNDLWLAFRAVSLLEYIQEHVGFCYYAASRPGIVAANRIYDKPVLADNISAAVGMRIHIWRLRHNWTLLYLGGKVGVDESTVSKHEKGKGITLDILPLYAEAFGLTVHDLIPDGKADNLYPENARQEKIRQAVAEFQKLENLSDEKLDEVLKTVTQIIHVALM